MTHLFAFLVLISAQPAHAERWCSGVITKLLVAVALITGIDAALADEAADAVNVLSKLRKIEDRQWVILKRSNGVNGYDALMEPFK
jgi:hypothetical protein